MNKCHCKVLSPDALTLEQKNIATRELNNKLRLEKKLDASIRPLMNRMNKDFKRKYASNGSIIDFSVYTGDLAAILRKHYDRVQRVFKKVKVKQVSNEELADLGLAEWQSDKVVTQPAFILNTTQRDANQSVRKAQQSLLEDGITVTAASVAVLAATFNRRKLLSRVSGIAITETQTAAESTKLIIAQANSGRVPYTVQQDPFAQISREEPIKEGTKQWVTVGDANVRSTHITADRQVVGIDDAFIVGGFKMRFPGDTSLGAPIREWVNCRCASNINIKF